MRPTFADDGACVVQEDYPAATTELLNFLSKCCGSALVLNVEDVADADYDAGTEELEGQISLEAEELARCPRRVLCVLTCACD